jgi:putative thioredoxin
MPSPASSPASMTPADCKLNSTTREFYPGAMIRDVTEANFQHDVIDRSHEVPVVVDFWAAWCGPCRQLTPILEDEVRKREPLLDLAKLDTDANQQISAAFRIQGIPAVKAFKNGKLAGEFVGAQPPPKVRTFLDSLLPSEADALVQEGDEQSLRRALELEPTRADAAIALANIQRGRGEREEALATLSNATGSYAAEGLGARIRLEDDPELAAAWAALDDGDQERGIDALIAAIAATGDEDRRDELRRAVVGVLDELGSDHPLAREARRKLAAALY